MAATDSKAAVGASAPAAATTAAGSSSGAVVSTIALSKTISVRLSVEPYVLSLRSVFGTSHSATTSRTNALIQITVTETLTPPAVCPLCDDASNSALVYCHDCDLFMCAATCDADMHRQKPFSSHKPVAASVAAPITVSWTGYGEVGMPPKKKGCYEANVNDIASFMADYSTAITHAVTSKSTGDGSYDPFSEFAATPYFATLRGLAPAVASAAPAPAPDAKSAPAATAAIGGAPHKAKSQSHTHRTEWTPRQSRVSAVCRELFRVLDTCSANTSRGPASESGVCRAALMGIESALFDCWGRILNRPVSDLIGLDWSGVGAGAVRPRSFYTAALNPEIEKMVESAAFGLQYTPLLKIKLDADVARGTAILKRLHEFYTQKASAGVAVDYKWSIDANAAWTPDIALAYLNALRPYGDRIYMVEQPFPLFKAKADYVKIANSTAATTATATTTSNASATASASASGSGSGSGGESVCRLCDDGSVEYPLAADTFARWRAVKEAYTKANIPIYGDESIATYRDVESVRELMHGVNVKLEKAGGYRSAIRAIASAKQFDLQVWIGVMVGSILNGNAAAQCLPLATNGYGDIDGALLITEETQRFEGGFVWGKPNGFVIMHPTSHAEENGMAPATAVAAAAAERFGAGFNLRLKA